MRYKNILMIVIKMDWISFIIALLALILAIVIAIALFARRVPEANNLLYVQTQATTADALADTANNIIYVGNPTASSTLTISPSNNNAAGKEVIVTNNKGSKTVGFPINIAVGSGATCTDITTGLACAPVATGTSAEFVFTSTNNLLRITPFD